jgi:hypothetical protein
MRLSCGGAAMSNPQAVFSAGDMCQGVGQKMLGNSSNIISHNPANDQGGGELQDVSALYDLWHPRNGVVHF